MVKGVSKRIIEVNQTGNKFFEKIVFYVSPEYGELSVSELKKATDGLSAALRESMGATAVPTLRQQYRVKKKKRAVCFVGLGFCFVTVCLWLIKIL